MEGGNVVVWRYEPPFPAGLAVSVAGACLLAAALAHRAYHRHRRAEALRRYAIQRLRRRFIKEQLATLDIQGAGRVGEPARAPGAAAPSRIGLADVEARPPSGGGGGVRRRAERGGRRAGGKGEALRQGGGRRRSREPGPATNHRARKGRQREEGPENGTTSIEGKRRKPKARPAAGTKIGGGPFKLAGSIPPFLLSGARKAKRK